MKEDNTMFYQAIGNSIQANKDKIEKLEKQNERLKKKNKSLQSQLKAKEEVEKEFIEYLEKEKENQKSEIFENSLTSEDINLYIMRVKLLKCEEILSKYNEILSKGENK